MKLIDKDALVAEIERKIKSLHQVNSPREQAVLYECKDILSFINSLPEEPVSNSVDFEQELYKAFGQVKDFTLCMRIAKWFYDMGKNSQEPVSEELEEEIIRYIGYPQEVDEDISTTMIRKAARHFANWQKTKDESTTEDLGEYINELSKQFPEVSFAKLSRIAVRVAKWQEEKMMAKAADATIGLPYENKNGGYTHLIDVSRPLPVGNNKIAIIFKED